MGGGGGAKYADPKLQRLHDQLDSYTNKLSAGDYDIPPEHERSPSPEPVYDANGIRLNTREIRCVSGVWVVCGCGCLGGC